MQPKATEQDHSSGNELRKEVTMNLAPQSSSPDVPIISPQMSTDMLGSAHDANEVSPAEAPAYHADRAHDPTPASRNKQTTPAAVSENTLAQDPSHPHAGQIPRRVDFIHTRDSSNLPAQPVHAQSIPGATASIIEQSKDEIIRTCELLHPQGAVYELRVLGASTPSFRKPHIEFGYFNDPVLLAEAARQISVATGFYITINPLGPTLLARSTNRLQPAKKGLSTANIDITSRRWLLVDCDPVRPSGISATDAEHECALARARGIREFLTQRGWPSPAFADSGNGAHLLYRVDLPVEDGGLVSRVLKFLDFQFSDAEVHVDVGVDKAAQTTKLYGSMARKGDSTPERPHRLARLLEIPEAIKAVPTKDLDELADLLPQKPKGQKGGGRGPALSLETWLRTHPSLIVREPKLWHGGQLWEFEICPWNAEHTNRSAFVVQFSNGEIFARCHHTSCSSNDWASLLREYPLASIPSVQATPAPLSVQDAPSPVKRLFPNDSIPHVPVGTDLLLPSGWEVTREQVSRFSLRGEQIAARGLVLITGRLKTGTDQEYLRLSWWRDNQWKDCVVSRATVANAREIHALAGSGCPVTTSTAKHLVEYLAEFEALNLAQLPLQLISHQMGWVGSETFLWGATALSPDGGKGSRILLQCDSAGDQQLANAFCAQGSVDEWLRAVATLAQQAPRFLATLYVALGTPLMKIFNVSSFVLDLSYETSSGKTTALRVAGSIWGNPDETQGASVLRSWQGTAVWIERTLSVYQSLPVLLDETKRASSQEILKTIAYEVAGGRGRERGTTVGTDVTRSWRTVVISTGESRLADSSQAGGVRVRILPLWGPPFGTVNPTTGNAVSALNQVVMNNYGLLGPAFVKFLVGHTAHWNEWRAEYQQEVLRYERQAGENHFARRQAPVHALISMTARLGHQAFNFPWGETNPMDALHQDLACEASEANRAAEAFIVATDWAKANPDNFYSLSTPRKPQPQKGWVGRWDHGSKNSDFIGIRPEVLHDILKRNDFEDYGAIIRLWKERGLLVTDQNAQHLTKQVRIANNEKIRVYALKHTKEDDGVSGTGGDTVGTTPGTTIPL